MTLALAMILDAVFGEPRWLWDRVPHPAALMGRAISIGEKRLNQGAARRAKGLALIAGLGLCALSIGYALSFIPMAEILIAAILLAQRSLVAHVQAVADGLRLSLNEGRRAVAMIVGRETADLTEPEIAKAAIESAAENLSDGVIAPAFWFALLGLPGIVLYKLVNTADSMIGYRNARYAQFGWAAARLDDVMNYVPARITAALIAAASGRLAPMRIAMSEGHNHASPNAGWAEAAMACAINTPLGGPRRYFGTLHDAPTLFARGTNMPSAHGIDAAVTILWRAFAIALGIVIFASIAL